MLHMTRLRLKVRTLSSSLAQSITLIMAEPFGIIAGAIDIVSAFTA
jgi:hypothetical protein